jgi:hypothetical protein
MQGDFMVRRGADDMGIESEQIAFEPELLQWINSWNSLLLLNKQIIFKIEIEF